MNFRSLLFSICFSLLTIFSGTAIARTSADVTTPPISIPLEANEVKLMQKRVEEIKSMDFSTLKRAEKKELKKELKGLKNELRNRGSGIYISLGGLLIVILLLIILL